MPCLQIFRLSHPCLVGLIAIFAIGSSSTAVATKPVKAGFGPFQVLEWEVGDCGTFKILNDFTAQGFFMLYFDQDGILKYVNQRANFSDSTYYNSEFPEVRIEGVPGEGVSERYDFTGDIPVLMAKGFWFKITLPGYGVIFHEVGRVIYEWTINSPPPGEILFQAGPTDFDEPDLTALCEVLTP